MLWGDFLTQVVASAIGAATAIAGLLFIRAWFRKQKEEEDGGKAPQEHHHYHWWHEG